MSSTDPDYARPPISLRAINKANWQYCIQLQLAPEQASKLASNLYSLAEAYAEPRCQPRGIYAGDMMLGFVMYEFNEYSGAYSIPRFMIDQRWQGLGYGRAALVAVIDALKSEHPKAPILISLTPDNDAARRLYTGLGFEETGQHVHGEDVLRHP